MKTGRDLKEKFMADNNLNINEYKVRLMNKGFEIKDDQKLCTHSITKDTNVQVIASKIPKDEEA